MIAKVVVFGNCQARVLADLINEYLDGYAALFLSNNARTGDQEASESVARHINEADVVVHQPFTSGDAAGSALAGAVASSKLTVSFPYIFNSGITTLGYAPMATGKSYGQVFGEEVICDYFDAGLELIEVVALYENGCATTNPKPRFDRDLSELQARERNIDVPMSDYIENEYRSDPLFVTHNHPTRLVFDELLARIATRLDLPGWMASRAQAAAPSNRYALPYTGAPYSPYDCAWLGYRFGFHSDWREKQQHLIKLVWDNLCGKQRGPNVFSSDIVVPDSLI